MIVTTKTSIFDIISCNCDQPEHYSSDQYDKPAKCVNCWGHTPANSKQYPQKERQLFKIKCEQNILFTEARKVYEYFNGAKTCANAVKPDTCNKATQS